MTSIQYIPASQISTDTTTYIDAQPGIVLAIEENDSTETLWITVEDPNGERVLQFDPAAKIPTLV